MKFLSRLFVILLCVTVSACDSVPPWYLEDQAPVKSIDSVGSRFHQTLSDEYYLFHNVKLPLVDPEGYEGDLFNSGQALFHDKAYLAADGENIYPENPVRYQKATNDMTVAYGELTRLFDDGARQLYPDLSSQTQVNFDCWVIYNDPICQADFQSHFGALKTAMREMPAPTYDPKPAPKMAMAAPVERKAPARGVMQPKTGQEAGKFLVFFDFDSANITQKTKAVLDQVFAEAKALKVRQVYLMGHADRSGPDTYNKKLSVKRAMAVSRTLVKMGMPAQIIRATGRGEKDMLRKTDDRVREPLNRRVEILIPGLVTTKE